LTSPKLLKNIIDFGIKIIDFAETTYYPMGEFRKIRRSLLVSSFSSLNIYYLESRNIYEN
jgi:hypothetical protein